MICETTLQSGDLFCPDCKHCVICREHETEKCACFELCLCQECGRELDTLRPDPEENTWCVKCDPDTPYRMRQKLNSSRPKRDTSPKRKQPKRQVKTEPTPPKPKSMSRRLVLVDGILTRASPALAPAPAPTPIDKRTPSQSRRRREELRRVETRSPLAMFKDLRGLGYFGK